MKLGHYPHATGGQAMNGKLRKLVQTNMVLYILLLLVFAGLTARLSPLLAAGPAGVVCEPAAQQGHAAAASPVCGAHLRRRRHRQDQQYAFCSHAYDGL